MDKSTEDMARRFLLIGDRVEYHGTMGTITGRNMHGMWIANMDGGAVIVAKRTSFALKEGWTA